ncbi:gliding motility-associated C-terminal domain-containing protein [uncultured Pedobacter sp.]|uniref:gliding motility-associated C-terminal domain-containing protein n=1 Tax=uncultured Pedobacter sp. TaxID=246139 RepID=UPI0025E93570|nr:gliding motility-associated C-terminal domain-containing protein [uncultured Pedobacter sp.]
MTKIYKFIFYVLVLLARTGVWAQSNSSNVLSSSGGHATVNGTTVEWSVGGTSVSSTASLPNGILLTQGFLQPIDRMIQLMLIFDPLASKTYEDVDFQLFARASDGSPVEYTSTNTDVAIILNGNTVKIVGAGTANIRATIKGTNISKDQLLLVDKATQMITFDLIPVLYKGDPAFTMNAYSNKGLPIAYHNSNPFVVRVSGNIITPVDLGRSTITVNQAGNRNYKAAEATQQVQVISREGDDISVPLAVTPNGDGMNDVLVIKGIEDFPDNNVVIVNRNGTKVFDVKNYDNSEIIFSGRGTYNGSFNGRLRTDNLPAGTYFYSIVYRRGGVTKRKTGYFVLKY